MTSCPFFAPGHQVACLALMKQREAAMTRPYSENPCYSCPQRVKRLEAAKPPQRINIPPADFRGAGKPVPPTPVTLPPTEKKETTVATDQKDQVFRQIEKTKSCTQSRITQYTHIKPNELAIIAAELEKEGRIKVWPRGGRNMYTLPDQPDPWPGKTYPPRKPPEKRVALKASATPPVALATPVVAPPVPSNGSVAAMIDQIRRMRDTYDANEDAAIAALEALR